MAKVIPMCDFKEECAEYNLIDDDGAFYLIKKGKVTNKKIYPSEVNNGVKFDNYEAVLFCQGER